eukprot:149936-Pelagomonas_calceolata.AAC.4
MQHPPTSMRPVTVMRLLLNREQAFLSKPVAKRWRLLLARLNLVHERWCNSQYNSAACKDRRKKVSMEDNKKYASGLKASSSRRVLLPAPLGPMTACILPTTAAPLTCNRMQCMALPTLIRGRAQWPPPLYTEQLRLCQVSEEVRGSASEGA